MTARLRRTARRLRGRADDRGFTLLEVMVGAGLMSVVMAIATTGFVTMYHTTDRTEANATVEANLMLSFSKLDRDVRYAYRINTPYTTTVVRSGASVTAYAVDYVIPDSANVLQCVQLTLPVAGGALIRTQWPQASNSADPATVTSGVATNLVTAETATDPSGAVLPANPFTLLPSGQGGSNFDRLQMNVNSTAGVTSRGATRTYDLQFTALNTVDLTQDLTCTKA
jgi:prepilin-type N-terminal cleavage/methylation domain-containing protein